MTADTFKFQMMILGNSDKLEVGKMKKLIDDAYIQLMKKPNDKLLEAVMEGENYITAKVEMRKFIDTFNIDKTL